MVDRSIATDDLKRRLASAEDRMAAAEAALREGETRHRLLIESWAQAVWETDADGVVVADSPTWRAYTGQTLEELLGYGWVDAVHPDDRAYAEQQWREAVLARRPVNAEFRLHAPDGRWRWTNVLAAPMLDAVGNIEKWLGLNIDIDARKRAEEALQRSEQHATLLLAELQHRVRNTLAMIRAIARRTAETTSTSEDMFAHFQGRLDAFSRVQGALTRSADQRMTVRSIIDEELVAHASREGNQVQVEGPEVWLESKAAERLSLAIHELTTNAVKHGALRNRGRIMIAWETQQIDGKPELFFNWREFDVGKVMLNNHQGFGMELLTRSLPYDVHGSSDVEFTPDGLQFKLRMPLTRP